MDPYLSSFIDYLCLCYHEARNVRHLIKAQHLSPDRFERLRSLPKNKREAWNAMARLRAAAGEAATAGRAADLFAASFVCSLEELIDLYRDPHWRSSAYGGNPWVEITTAVCDLRRALDDGDVEETSRLSLSLSETRHNTGTVGSKLHDLSRAAGGGQR